VRRERLSPSTLGAWGDVLWEEEEEEEEEEKKILSSIDKRKREAFVLGRLHFLFVCFVFCWFPVGSVRCVASKRWGVAGLLGRFCFWSSGKCETCSLRPLRII